jgi:uncharacterized protein (DUF1330 family)
MRKFKAKIKEIDGKKVLVIEPQSEEIINPDGTKSVIIHAPKLSTIQKMCNSPKVDKLINSGK